MDADGYRPPYFDTRGHTAQWLLGRQPDPPPMVPDSAPPVQRTFLSDLHPWIFRWYILFQYMTTHLKPRRRRQLWVQDISKE
jgi:hypothetical protein